MQHNKKRIWRVKNINLNICIWLLVVAVQRNGLEESLEGTCPHCGKAHHADFSSVFSGKGYLVGTCRQCGYAIEVEEMIVSNQPGELWSLFSRPRIRILDPTTGEEIRHEHFTTNKPRGHLPNQGGGD